MKSKIIILANDYLPNNGGIARLCFEIKKVLRLKGHDVVVIAKETNQGLDCEGDLNVKRVGGNRIEFELNVLRYLLLNSSKNDIVITDTFHPCGSLSLLLGKKTFILAHGAELFPAKTFLKRLIWDNYRSFVLRKASAIIANSKYTKKLVELCSKKSNVVAIPLAVDELVFKPIVKKGDRCFEYLTLSSISRLEKFKGHDFIIETIADLPTKYRERIKLNIAGKGSYTSDLQELINSLNLNNQIKLCGFIENDQMCNFYTSSDVFILCTREEPLNNRVEGFGLVFLEAQSSGIPVIGACTGGIPDAVEEQNGGWLIKPDNKRELSDLLIKLIENPELVIESGKQARKRVEESCTWGVYYNEIIRELYK